MRIVVALIVALFGWADHARGQDADRGPGKETLKGDPAKKPRLTISKETTFITAPKDKDGFLDYVAALNERLKKGANPKNNANVLLWQAWGPHPEGGASMPEAFYAWMGIAEPPPGDDYLVDHYKYAKVNLGFDPVPAAWQDDLDACHGRPWKAKDFPNIAGWLKLNEKPLRLVREAAKRSHYFSPVVPPGRKNDEGLFAVLLPGVQKTREIAYALAIRSMLHLGEGRQDEAWEDLLTLHRLGRHVATGGTLIENLVGIALEHIACHAETVYLDQAKLDAKAVKKSLRDLEELPPIMSPAETLDLAERFMLLDTVMKVERFGLPFVQGLKGIGFEIPGELPEGLLDKIEWDDGLRAANRWYDRLGAAMRLKDRAAREKQFDQIDEELRELKKKLAEPVTVLKFFLDPKTTPQARGKLGSEALVALLLPAVRKVSVASDRRTQVNSNTQAAFALVAYQRDNGSFPKKLADLAPKYLAAIPDDVFAGKALAYRPSDKSFLLYSVGMNGMDDKGHSFEDDPPGDDLAIRFPLSH